MKIQKVTQYFSLLIFMAVATGCTQLTGGKATFSPVASVLPTNSVTPTKMMSPTSMHLGTPTAVPTLSVEDARKKLLAFLENNGDCRLPCLWGITPGKSDYQEARSILIPLSNISDAKNTYFDPAKVRGVLLGTITPLYIEGDQRLNNWEAYLYNEDGIVSSIGFRVFEDEIIIDSNGNRIGEQPIFDSASFAKRVEYYSLSHVLSELGVPDSVMLHASNMSGYPVVAGGVWIALFYPDQGVWVNYTMPMYNDGNIKKGCPAYSHIEMELYPPGNPDTFFSSLEKTDWAYNKGGYIPLEEATSMSVEEFYEAFRNPTDKCIETPAKIWPTPEP